MPLFARCFPVVLAAVVLLINAGPAAATHPRPKGATPFTAPLVPAYKACAAPGNRTHGAPLAFASCSPPAEASDYLTTGTPDANGAAANMVGSIDFSVKATSPEDVLIDFDLTDVRCKPSVSTDVCPNTNTAGGPDYSGELQWYVMQRASDHYNGPGLNEAATVIDLPGYFLGSAVLTCAATADPSTGGSCSLMTTQNAIVVGSVHDLGRVNLQLDQVLVTDGGSDGQVSTTADNTLFLVRGLFVP